MLLALVDTGGNVQERYVYDPYGSMTILAANWTTRGSSSYSWVYGHQGGRLDNATGAGFFSWPRFRDLIRLSPIPFIKLPSCIDAGEAQWPMQTPAGEVC
jgi:hypothetical protein